MSAFVYLLDYKRNLPIIIVLAKQLRVPRVTRVIERHITNRADKARLMPTCVDHSHQKSILNLQTTAFTQFISFFAFDLTNIWKIRKNRDKNLKGWPLYEWNEMTNKKIRSIQENIRKKEHLWQYRECHFINMHTMSEPEKKKYFIIQGNSYTNKHTHTHVKSYAKQKCLCLVISWCSIGNLHRKQQ